MMQSWNCNIWRRLISKCQARAAFGKNNYLLACYRLHVGEQRKTMCWPYTIKQTIPEVERQRPSSEGSLQCRLAVMECARLRRAEKVPSSGGATHAGGRALSLETQTSRKCMLRKHPGENTIPCAVVSPRFERFQNNIYAMPSSADNA